MGASSWRTCFRASAWVSCSRFIPSSCVPRGLWRLLLFLPYFLGMGRRRRNPEKGATSNFLSTQPWILITCIKYLANSWSCEKPSSQRLFGGQRIREFHNRNSADFPMTVSQVSISPKLVKVGSRGVYSPVGERNLVTLHRLHRLGDKILSVIQIQFRDGDSRIHFKGQCSEGALLVVQSDLQKLICFSARLLAISLG